MNRGDDVRGSSRVLGVQPPVGAMQPRDVTISVNFKTQKNDAEDAMRQLLGNRPLRFCGADLALLTKVEEQRRAEIAERRCATVREGKVDTGCSVFIERFPNGVKNVTLAGIVDDLTALGYPPVCVFVDELERKDHQSVSIGFNYWLRIRFARPTEALPALPVGVAQAIRVMLAGVWKFMVTWDNRAASAETIVINLTTRQRNVDPDYKLVVDRDWSFALSAEQG